MITSTALSGKSLSEGKKIVKKIRVTVINRHTTILHPHSKILLQTAFSHIHIKVENVLLNKFLPSMLADLFRSIWITP